MAMSVAHRLTGLALYAGTVLLAWYLAAAAIGGGYFDVVSWLFGSIIGRIVLFFYTFALMHHALGGLRHLVWDLGIGFEHEKRLLFSRATLYAALALTVVLWILSFL